MRHCCQSHQPLKQSINYYFPVMMFIVLYKCFNNRKLIFAMSVVIIIKDCISKDVLLAVARLRSGAIEISLPIKGL